MIPIRDHLPTRSTPYVTWMLIALNVIVFLFEQSLMGATGGRVIQEYGFVPLRFMADPVGEFFTIGTAMFMHGGWLHLIGNMWFLWIFGDNVEDRLGKSRYLAFYLLSGILAAFTQLAIDPASRIPMVGASGAIAGVLAGYLMLYPRARVTVLVPIFIFFQFFDLPAFIVIAGWFLLQLLHGMSSLAGPSQGGVAFFAHIGGFLAGLFLVRVFDRPTAPPPPRRPDPWDGWLPPGATRDPRLRDRTWSLTQRKSPPETPTGFFSTQETTLISSVSPCRGLGVVAILSRLFERSRLVLWSPYRLRQPCPRQR
ncbi:MAG: rhomboid family intramembrane serine protease [Polyangiaceae bacterium]